MIHLAIDIGASSGRHIAAWREDGKMVMKEIYRFPNGAVKKGNALVWDIDALFSEIINGLIECRYSGIIPDSIGIDTWGVDYVLLDNRNMPILPVYCYRDERGGVSAPLVHKKIPFEKLYEHTGIQFEPFNTIYQLYYDKKNGRLDIANDFLMLPEYLAYCLSGVKKHEYTNCSTTGLLNAKTRKWDKELLETLGFQEKLFTDEPETAPIILGKLKKEIAERIGFTADVILPATHDTGSAVASLRETDHENAIFISSGTWSLMGVELSNPATNAAALAANFSNEGGIGTIRFLKNIMGLWLIQCLKKELDDKYSFLELAEMAEKEAFFDYQLDVDDGKYLAPDSVMKIIEKECDVKGWPIPETPGQYANAIYISLAHVYDKVAKELEKVTGTHYGKICIIGGGSNNKYLNKLTEKITGKKVILGSSEATALGNILLQEAAYV